LALKGEEGNEFTSFMVPCYYPWIVSYLIFKLLRYFDSYGIIRDITQNHLLQILALFAMETPISLEAEDIRNEKVCACSRLPRYTVLMKKMSHLIFPIKQLFYLLCYILHVKAAYINLVIYVEHTNSFYNHNSLVVNITSIYSFQVKVLRSMKPLQLEDVVIGQYKSHTKGGITYPGYTDDKTVPKGSLAPTFAAAALFINNARWDGVPFLMKAGKALHTKQ
jgi:hypothetical protein